MGRPKSGDEHRRKVVAKAIIEDPKLQEKYLAQHPTQMLSSEVQMALDQMLGGLPLWDVTKEKICQFLQFVILRYMQGKESGANALRAVELAAKLVPDFKDRKEVSEIDKLNPEQVDQALRLKLRQMGMQSLLPPGGADGIV